MIQVKCRHFEDWHHVQLGANMHWCLGCKLACQANFKIDLHEIIETSKHRIPRQLNKCIVLRMSERKLPAIRFIRNYHWINFGEAILETWNPRFIQSMLESNLSDILIDISTDILKSPDQSIESTTIKMSLRTNMWLNHKTPSCVLAHNCTYFGHTIFKSTPHHNNQQLSNNLATSTAFK